MYNSQEIANRIKSRAKALGLPIGTVLSTCGLGKNTISKIGQGTDILTLNFAKIADCLNCSVDYLLGRTDVPDVNAGKSLIDQEVDAYRADLELEARLASSVSSTPDVKEA